MDFTSVLVIGNAFMLGIRHGVDWDHIAAIADIVGTANATKLNRTPGEISAKSDALRLSSCYAFGHATIVLILGVAALVFASVLPAWIDPMMEKAVGITLLLLGGWIFYSLMQQVLDRKEIVLQSFWMIILAKAEQACRLIHTRLTGTAKLTETKVRTYNAAGAFGIGVIHGFGAETGTQFLLIAAVGGSSSHVLAVMLLLSFIFGLLISNTLIALLSCAGFVKSAKFNNVFVAASAITGLFSLVVGTIFTCGYASMLPELRH